MATIAELQIKVDSTPVEKGVKALNDFAAAADKAAKARKALNDAMNGGGGGGPGPGADDAESKRTRSLSEAIDAQTRKLADLAAQRKKLNDSPMRTENPAEYARLNREIDARTELVNRQGNSLDRLAAQANKEQKAREQAAKSAQALADREAKALEAREALQARLAASQQRNLDNTIAGLSRQIKAQQDYNKEIATLNLNRFQGRITGGEFETYSRLAAVKRDDALATQDNTKELERNQRMLDSITATLGRTERAEVTLKRAVDTLNQGLTSGLLTQEQYDKQLSLHTAKRDAAVAAANNGSAAEARFSAQLKSVLSAYNPVIRATDEYAASQAILRQGLSTGEINIRQYVAALKEQKAALDQVKASQSGSTEQQAKQYQAALDRLLPFNAQLRNLNEAEKVLQQTKAAGKVTTDQQIADYERATKAIAAERLEIERRSQAERKGNSAKQDAAALRGLPAQFTDVVVSLQGGQAPLTVLLQQGGQVKDMFGGVGNAIKAVGGALLAMVTPMTVLGAVVAVVGTAFYQGAHEATDFNKAIAQSAGFSGASAVSFTKLRESIAKTAGTMGLAAEILSEMQRSGKITVAQFESIGIAAAKMQRVTGAAVKDTVADFASLAKDPANAVLTLDEKYKGLTSSVYAQISALQRQGDTVQATIVAQEAMAQGATNLADAILPNLGYIEAGWKKVKEVVADTWDIMKSIGRDNETTQLQLAERALAKLKENPGQTYAITGIGSGVQTGKKGIEDLELFIKAQRESTRETEKQTEAEAQRKAIAEQARKESLRGQQIIDAATVANMKQSERLTEQLEQRRRAYSMIVAGAVTAGTTVDKKQTDQAIAAINDTEKKIKAAKEQEAKAGVKTTPLDTRQVQDVKSNLNVVLSEYDGYYKKVTALGKANIVSAEATHASQKSILQAEAKAVSSSYDEQIAEIKKLQGVKGNNAAQTISLANQMSRAEDQRTKSMQDNAAKQERLDIEEKGRIDARTASIEAYSEALRQSIENTALSGQRAVAAVGQGDRQGKLNEDLADADRQFAKDQQQLAKQLGKGMDLAEYTAKLADLQEAHSDMTKQIIKNDEDIKEAEGEWTNGLTKAIQNYAAAASNFASMMNNAVSGAFDSMGDALADFVTTGKLDFRSLASSIIADMAKIAAKAATNAALTSLFQAGMSAYSGFNMGTTTGSSGFSDYGQITTQAKGGGWSQGTQFFAKGGAFTNSIVSSPTAFNGGAGVMGEAGPEAIMPLARSSDGSLGVRMVGGGGSGGVIVYVNIASDGSVESSTNSDSPKAQQFGKELGDFVDNRYRTLLSRDLKDGGAIKNAMA